MTLCPLRTLITGMASGSIVAFNIDFNRWHYEHQNRYWGGQREEEEDGEKRKKQEGEEVMHSAVYLRRAGGKPQVPRGRNNKHRTLGLWSWLDFEDASALVETTSSVHTCMCNHRHILPRRYTPKPANKIDRLQNGDKERVKQIL